MATSTLMAKMAELQMNRANADVTFNCDGKVIKAHSFILGMRYVANWPSIHFTNDVQSTLTVNIGRTISRQLLTNRRR